MDKSNVLILEDDRSAARKIGAQLDQLGYAEVQYIESLEALESAVGEQRPTLVLVNVAAFQQPDEARLINRLHTSGLPVVLLVGAPNDAQSEALRRLRPTTHLARPFDALHLQHCIEAAALLVDDSWQDRSTPRGLVLRDRVYVKKNNRLERILIDDILWIRADGNYCFVQVGEKRFVIKISLRKLLATLPTHLFTQIQKSFAVHLARVEAIDLNTNHVVVEGHLLPMGRSFREDVIARINLIR